MNNKELVLMAGKSSGSGGGLTDDVKLAFLNAFSHVAWTDEHGQDYVDELKAALYPSAGLVGIAALYTQSGPVYDTDSLDSLRVDLVVTATYDNGDVRTVTDYTLSGTLTVGTSTITVSYGGKTATFTVTVSESALYRLTESDFLRGYGNTPAYGSEPHYAESASSRISYNKFDLLLEAGKQYIVEATVTPAYSGTAQMAFQYFNQNALDAVANNARIDNNDIDVNTNIWGNLSITITVPATIHQNQTKGTRLTFRQSSSNPDISQDFSVTGVTINEVSE